MNRLLALFLLSACCATAQIETPGSGVGGSGSGGSGTPYYGPFTNLAVYGTSTNFGTNYTFFGYRSNLLYQPVSLSSSASLLVNMLGGSMQVMTMTTNVTISVTNVSAGANVSVLLIGPTNNQYNVIMPSYVRLFSGAITNAVTTNKSMIVSLTAFNSNTNDLVATISIQP
jgi:hypothetical protein